MSRTDPDPKNNRPDGTRPYRPAEPQPEPLADPNLPKIPGITLQHEVARGGMGVVYVGRQDFLDRRVAVKLLSVELGGESFVQRFQREAKILAGIKHPNIVACHMAGQTDEGQSYLVMEFIDGPSLKKWIGDNGPVPVKAALRATRAIAQALGHAHTLGIIHRDVKPENILLEMVTSTALDLTFPYTPKVVDLGLARADSGNAAMGLTSPGSVMGTPATMSPEQFDDPDSVDFRTDIYGIGCVLFEMLVGQPAFRAKKLTEIVTQKRSPMAPDPSIDNPLVLPEIALLVQSMLAPDREQRPRSYKELDERLQQLMQSIDDMPAPRVIGEETGQTIIAKPNQLKSKPPGSGSQAPKSQAPKSVPPKSQPPKSPEPSMDKSSPGLLRTAEINFLAEGLDGGAGAANAPPAFREDAFDGAGPGGGEFKGGTVVPKPAPVPVAATSAPTAAMSGVGAPPKKKGGVVAIVAGLAVAAAGGGYWMSRPAEDPVTPGPGTGGDKPVVVNPNPDKPKPQPSGNKPPVVGEIRCEEKVDLKKTFFVEIEAFDPENKALTYTWSWPEDRISAKRQEKTKLTLVMDDGLPGVECEIAVEVTDGENPITKKRIVVVGKCDDTRPWVSFKSNAEWRRDKVDICWVENSDPEDGHVRGQADKELRTLQTSLGEEGYWEWYGSLKSENVAADAPFAVVGLRFEFGDQGYAVISGREGGGLQGFVEVVKIERSNDRWQVSALPTPVRVGWTQPADIDATEDFRAWFSVQRRGDQLTFQVGKARQPDEGAEITEPGPSTTFAVPASATPGTLTLFVDQGLGRFRIKRR